MSYHQCMSMSVSAWSPGGGRLLPPQPTRLKVFLSHATKDTDAVDMVKRQIEALGVDVYLAEHDPRPGTSIAAKIQAELAASHVLVVLLTDQGVDSNYVHQEIGLARGQNKPIIPIVDITVDPSRLGMLKEVEWLEVDFSQPTEALEKLTRSIQPFIMRQVQTMHVSLVSISPQIDLATGIAIFALGALFALLVFSIAQGSTNHGA